MIRLLVIGTVVLCTAGMQNSAARGQDDRPLKLWYDRPAREWMTEAGSTGNGRIGAMVFGGVGRERVPFNDKTLWTGSEQEETTRTQATFTSSTTLRRDYLERIAWPVMRSATRVETPERRPKDRHRHVSQLTGLYPDRQISPLLDKKYADAARVSLTARGDGGICWIDCPHIYPKTASRHCERR